MSLRHDAWCADKALGDNRDGGVFIHVTPKDKCEHDFQGWCEFEDGLGGETVCTKCGMGSMAYTLSLDI